MAEAGIRLLAWFVSTTIEVLVRAPAVLGRNTEVRVKRSATCLP
jgi:hypothetical protein